MPSASWRCPLPGAQTPRLPRLTPGRSVLCVWSRHQCGPEGLWRSAEGVAYGRRWGWASGVAPSGMCRLFGDRSQLVDGGGPWHGPGRQPGALRG